MTDSTWRRRRPYRRTIGPTRPRTLTLRAAALALPVFVAPSLWQPGNAFQAQTAITAQGERQLRVVKGRDNPELIPEEVAWTTFFLHLRNMAADENMESPNPEKLRHVATKLLRVSDEDGRLVFAVAIRCLKERETALGPVTAEHAGAAILSPDERQAAKSKATAVITDARNKLRESLSDTAFLAVRNFLETQIVPTIEMQIRK